MTKAKIIRLKRLSHFGLLIFPVSIFICLFAVSTGLQNSSIDFICGISIVGMLLSLCWSIAFEILWQRSIMEIAYRKDNPMVEILVDALDTTQMRTTSFLQQAVRSGLIRGLPKLKGTDVNLLTRKQRTHLYDALLSGDPALVLAVLKGVQIMGDREALPYVRNLARRRYHVAADPDVWQAAIQCLDVLEDRIQQGSHVRDLLRPSEMAATASGELMRPAAGNGICPSSHLLRANNGTQESAD